MSQVFGLGRRPLIQALRNLPTKDDIQKIVDAVNGLPQSEASLSDPLIDITAPVAIGASPVILGPGPINVQGYLGLRGYAVFSATAGGSAIAGGTRLGDIIVEISPDGSAFIPVESIAVNAPPAGIAANTTATIPVVITISVVENIYRLSAVSAGAAASFSLARARIRGTRRG